MKTRAFLSQVVFVAMALPLYSSCRPSDAPVAPELLEGVGDATGAVVVNRISDNGAWVTFRADWPTGAAAFAWDARPLDLKNSPKRFGETDQNSVVFQLQLQSSPYPAILQVWQRSQSGQYSKVGQEFFVVEQEASVSTDPCAAVTGVLTLGGPVENSLTDGDCRLHNGAYADRWEFALQNSAAITIHLGSVYVDTHIYLVEGWVTDPRDPLQSPGIISEDEDHVLPLDSRITTRLEPGSYAVYATGTVLSQAGVYRLLLQPDPCAPSAGVLADGETWTGDLTHGTACKLYDGHYADRWEFEPDSYSDIQIDLRSTEFDELLYLTEPWVTDPSNPDQSAGVLAVDRGMYLTRIVTTLVPGRYAVYATTDAGSETGSYGLSFGLASPCAVATSAEVETRESGDLHEGDCLLTNGRLADRWEFSVDSWTPLQIDLTSGDFDAYLYLVDRSVFDPTDPRQEAGIIAYNDDGFGFDSRIEVALAAGEYAIYSSTYNPREAGAYTLSLTVLACVDDTDTDGDRLADCHETNTGIFEDVSDTGTDPFNPDTDGDAINDGDEVLGTVDGLDLPAMGVSPLQKDILVEYDWFNDALHCGPHSHRPDGDELFHALVFAEAPVPNPGRWDGINLIQDYGQGGVFTGGDSIDDPDATIGDPSSAEFQQYRAENLAPNRDGYFHYVILGHQRKYVDKGEEKVEWGVGRSDGAKNIVMQMGCLYLDDWKMAGTLMHELGHNLGLHHGGNTRETYQPNYNSVMNYRYGSHGVDAFGCDAVSDSILDFSRGVRPDLDENNLNEYAGVCGWGDWLDWNGNGVIEESVSFDINAPPSDPENTYRPRLTVLRDYNDWGNLDLSGIRPLAAQAVGSGAVTCDFGRRTSPW